MSNAIQASGFTAPQLRVIRTTVAADTNDVEFDLFMEACRSYGLDPFRKQIHAVVYNKDKPDKRKMTIIVSRDGLRVMASRCGDYRPASEPAEIEVSEAAANPDQNPHGLICARVRLWKQDRGGGWYPVIGEAFWEEFAPLKEIWAPDPDDHNKRKPTGRFALEHGNWTKMPRLMLTKCAESQALRAGWPETFGGVYAEEELHRLSSDVSAADALKEFEKKEREARTGGPGLLLVFDDSAKLQKVPMGQVFDRVNEFVRDSDAEEVHKFEVRNEDALRDFWAHDKPAALELRKLLDAKTKNLSATQGAA